MATNIVPSLFGLSQQQVRQQQLAEDRQFAQEFAATQATPYARERAMLGATLGSALTRGVAGLFGLQTGQEQTASAMDEALKVATASLPPEQRNNRAAIMSKVSEVLGSSPNFQRQAFDAQMQAAQFAREDNEAAADVAYKKSLTDYYGVLQTDKLAEQETKKLERQGQVAFGALNSLQRAKDPADQTRIWENAITALEKQGLDVSTLKELPWEQRANVLEGIVDTSESSATRVKAEVAAVKNDLAAKTLEERGRHNLQMEALQNEKMNLQMQLKQMGINSAQWIATNGKLNNIDAQMDRLDKTNAWRTQGQFTSQIGTKEFDKNIKGYLREELKLSEENIAKALPTFNSIYGKYLGEKDENGYPKYDSNTALNMAKKELESGTKDMVSTVGGVSVPFSRKKVFDSSNIKPPVIKLD